MKLFSQFLLLTIIAFGFSCSPSKMGAYQLQKEAPFKIETATYQEWVAGVGGGGAGITIILEINELNTEQITLDSIYFRNYKAPLLKSKGNYIAHIKTEINNRDDITLHQSPQKEYGNQAPVLKNDTSFHLSKKEAIIRFKEKNKIKYARIVLTQIASPLYQ